MKKNNPGAVIEETIRYRLLSDFFKEVSADTLLDLGCGPRPYLTLYKDRFAKTIGADLPDSPFPKEMIDIYCTATDIPLENESMDVVLSTEVMHDIAEPKDMLAEVRRILKPGGRLVLTTPFVVPTVDGSYDHYRYTEQGLKYLLASQGFGIISITPVSDVIGSMITLYIKPWLRLWNRLSKLLRMKFIYSRVNPFFFLTVSAPQYLYLISREIPLIRRFLKNFSYGPIGYVTIASKK